MQETSIKNMLKEIEKYVKESVIIKQTGFISNQFYISSLTYSLKIDTLTIKDEEQEIYVSINLNQVYKIDIQNDSLQLYLDNDTQICIKNKVG